jgi:hypothetical protein
MPASVHSLPKNITDKQACSAGFTTTVLPAAIAGAIFQTACSSG